MGTDKDTSVDIDKDTSLNTNLNTDTDVVSIIVPVYNTRPELLVRAIESVLGQTYAHHELVLVDDCSTQEETRAVLETYAGRERVQLIHNRTSQGTGGSRNIGIEKARGEWVGFLDHDDYMKPDFIRDLLSHATPDVQVLVSGWDNVNEKGELLSRFPAEAAEFGSEGFAARNGMVWNRLLRRKTLLEREIRFPKTIMEDTAFIMLCGALELQTVVVPVWDYCYYSVNASSITHQKKHRSRRCDQLPLAELERVIDHAADQKDVYYQNNVVNNIMQAGCYLTTYSDRESRRQITDWCGRMFRRLHFTKEEMRRVLDASDNSAVGRGLLWGYWFASAHHMEQLYGGVTNVLVRMLRG